MTWGSIIPFPARDRRARWLTFAKESCKPTALARSVFSGVTTAGHPMHASTSFGVNSRFLLKQQSCVDRASVGTQGPERNLATLWLMSALKEPASPTLLPALYIWLACSYAAAAQGGSKLGHWLRKRASCSALRYTPRLCAMALITSLWESSVSMPQKTSPSTVQAAPKWDKKSFSTSPSSEP
eukprot:1288682-Lingulodinium_polyedra.AAC.1